MAEGSRCQCAGNVKTLAYPHLIEVQVQETLTPRPTACDGIQPEGQTAIYVILFAPTRPVRVP